MSDPEAVIIAASIAGGTALVTVFAPMFREWAAARARRERERQDAIGEALQRLVDALYAVLLGRTSLPLEDPNLLLLGAFRWFGLPPDLATATGLKAAPELTRLELLLTKDERQVTYIALSALFAARSGVKPEARRVVEAFTVVAAKWHRGELKPDAVLHEFQARAGDDLERVRRRQSEHRENRLDYLRRRRPLLRLMGLKPPR